MPSGISDSDREAFHDGNNYNSNQSHQPKYAQNISGVSLSIAKVFLYMFIGLLITAGVAFGVGAFVYYQIVVNGNGEITTPYLIALIVSAILLFVDMLVINFVTIKGKHSILIPGIIYAILVGILFSMLTIVVDWKLIGMAFGVTALAFLVMSTIAFLSKGNMSPILIVVFGLLIGAGLLSLFNWIIMLTTGGMFESLYWIVSFAIFAVVMFITIFDLWRIKKIAEQGMMSNNLALYCAFVIYVDFINVFIRVLYFIILIVGKYRR